MFLFQSENSDVICYYFETEWVRTDFLETNSANSQQTLYTIRFIKNCRFVDLYTFDFEHRKAWLVPLRKVFTQVDFHLRYKNIKGIGKGSYARVYLVERREDKQRFAVKAFKKNYLE